MSFSGSLAAAFPLLSDRGDLLETAAHGLCQKFNIVDSSHNLNKNHMQFRSVSYTMVAYE
jgi:hypothetical protein